MRPLKKKMQRVVILPDGETYEMFDDCYYADLSEEQVERLQDGEGFESLIDEGLKLYSFCEDEDDEDDEDDDEYDD